MKKFGALLMAVLLVVGATPSAFAAEQETVSEPYSIEFNDSTLDGATKISDALANGIHVPFKGFKLLVSRP